MTNLTGSKTIIALAFYLMAQSVQAGSTSFFTSANFNLRAGPGTEHRVVDTIMLDLIVSVSGCIEGFKWCKVRWFG